MWRPIKSSVLWVTRPARVVYHKRQSGVREFRAAPIMLVKFAPDFGAENLSWVESALAFSMQSMEIQIENESEISQDSIGKLAGKLQEVKPSSVLYIGRVPTKEEVATLKLHQIPYRAVTKLEPPRYLSEFPADEGERAKWHGAFDRRPVIYMHLTRGTNLPLIMDAFRAARRNFPNLLMVVSGINREKVIPFTTGLNVGSDEGETKSISFLDILVFKSGQYIPVLSSVATVQLVTQTRDMRQVAREAIRRCAAVVFYDVRLSSVGPFSELTNSGALWNVTRKGSLGATLSQVLKLEDAANTSSQSVIRLDKDEAPLLIAIEELMNSERAA